MKLFVLLSLLIPALAFAQAPSVDGEWKAELDAGAQRLPLVLTLGEKVSIRTPTQGNITVDGQMTRTEQGISLAFPANGVRIELKPDADGKALRGFFSQRGLQIPVLFSRDGSLRAELVRPQTPRPPFPYRSEEVAYLGDGVGLAGALTLPPGAGPFPAVLLITGSGAQDRDETILGHKPFLLLADALTRKGIAVLRVDDRGVGGSGGATADASLDVQAKDVAAGLSLLRSRADIDKRRIGLLGHSEGAVVAPIVAAADPDVSFVVLLAPPAVNGAELVIHQQRLMLEAAGVPPAIVAQSNAQQAIISRLVRSDADDETVKARVREMLAGLPAGQAEAQAAILVSPAYRSMMRHDPAPVLAKLKVPVLALWGSKDLTVSPGQSEPLTRASLANNPKARIEVLPGLNHLLQTAPTGAVSEYGVIEETIAPSALTLITDWVVQQTR